LEPLARAIEAEPCGDLTFIVGEKSRPLTKESFGNSSAGSRAPQGQQVRTWRTQTCRDASRE